jgi:hypothetical protein
MLKTRRKYRPKEVTMANDPSDTPRSESDSDILGPEQGGTDVLGPEEGDTDVLGPEQGGTDALGPGQS